MDDVKDDNEDDDKEERKPISDHNKHWTWLSYIMNLRETHWTCLSFIGFRFSL